MALLWGGYIVHEFKDYGRTMPVSLGAQKQTGTETETEI